MSYRLHDEIENGDSGDGELPSRSRHGAHSSDRLSTETGVRRYTYERPAGAIGRSRHAAPDDSTYSAEPETYSAERDRNAAAEFWGSSAPAARDNRPSSTARDSWQSDSYSCETGSHSYHTGADDPGAASSGYGGANYGSDGYGGTNYDAAGYGGLNYEGRTDADAPPPPRWTPDSASYEDTAYRNTTYGDTGYGDGRYRGSSGYDAAGSYETVRGGEPSAWDEQALRAAAGASYSGSRSESRYQTEPLSYPAEPLGYRPEPQEAETTPLAPARGGTLTATRPPRTRRSPAEEAQTEVVEAEPIEAPADVEVPTTPPSAARRLLFGRSHAGLRVAAVAVLVVGSAVGIAAGVLHDSNPDTVKVTDDIQAASISTSAPTPDPAASQTQAAPVGAQLMIQQRQAAALEAAKKRAADKAAAVQRTAAATARRAETARASRSETRTSDGTTGTTGNAVPTAPVDCKTYSGNRATGCALLQEFSFDSSQMSCLDKLWTRESQWSTSAENSSTGAYGIPQALPGSKMATVADDWKTNAATQIRWGLGYIKGRYSTPCGAWSHSESTGWY